MLKLATAKCSSYSNPNLNITFLKPNAMNLWHPKSVKKTWILASQSQNGSKFQFSLFEIIQKPKFGIFESLKFCQYKNFGLSKLTKTTISTLWNEAKSKFGHFWRAVTGILSVQKFWPLKFDQDSNFHSLKLGKFKICTVLKVWNSVSGRIFGLSKFEIRQIKDLKVWNSSKSNICLQIKRAN